MARKTQKLRRPRSKKGGALPKFSAKRNVNKPEPVRKRYAIEDFIFSKEPAGFDKFMDDATAFFNRKIYSDVSYDININTLRDLCIKHAELVELQDFNVVRPGDILYYSVGHAVGEIRYIAGHIETVLGAVSRKDGNIGIIRAHPGEDEFNILEMLVNPREVDDKIHIFRYKGEKANLINSTSAFLAKLFVAEHRVDYGGFCKIIFSICEEHPEKASRMKYLQETMEELFTTNKSQKLVCSGLSLLMIQLAFFIHGLEDALEYAVPFNAKACSPLKVKTMLAKESESWDMLPFPRIINQFLFTRNDNDVSCIFKTERSHDKY